MSSKSVNMVSVQKSTRVRNSIIFALLVILALTPGVVGLAASAAFKVSLIAAGAVIGALGAFTALRPMVPVEISSE